MKRYFFFLYVVSFLVIGAFFASAGQITLTTYYPSPSGNYNKLTANNVGIGTPASTSVALDVNGEILANEGLPTPPCAWGYNAGYSFNNDGCSDTGMFSAGDGDLRFFSNSVDAMNIIPGGNVGIGTTVPGYPLDVRAPNGALSTAIQFGSVGYHMGLLGENTNTNSIYLTNTYGSANSFIEFRMQGSATPSMVINGSGNVGIGTTSPSYPLSVNGEIANVSNPGYFPAATLETWGLNKSVGSTLYIEYGGPSMYITDGWQYTNPLVIVTGTIYLNAGNVPGLMVNTNGNVGIGTTSPGETLDVSGVVRSNNEIISTITGGGSGQFRMISGNYGMMLRNDGANTYFLLTASGNPYGGWSSLRPLYINDSTGDVTMGTNLNAGGTITAASDQRLKKNILPITGALDKVRRLNGVTFTWKKSGIKDIGVIAQNVEKVLPEIVHTGKDGMKGVEYGNLTALLIEAIKEQQKEIEELQKKIGR